MQQQQDEVLRQQIAALLRAGLKTTTEPFPEDGQAFAGLQAQLQQLAPDDLQGKLVIAGFLDRPYGEAHMRCQECMYYASHRKWCVLPELQLPVEPEWWCRLRRI